MCHVVHARVQVVPHAIPFLRQLEKIVGNLVLDSDNGGFAIADAAGLFSRLQLVDGDLTITATHLASLLAQPHKYLEYFAWKRAPLPSAFQHRLAFVGTHAKCRLCRWAYAKKFGFRWSRETQEVLLEPARTREGGGSVALYQS